jgi:hypothetical protein
MPEIRVKILSEGAPRGMARQLPKILKRGYHQTGTFWFLSIMPKHFTASATAAYRYKRRSKSYRAKKSHYKHHTNPLSWSKEMEHAIGRGGTRVSATSKGANVPMRGPVYLRSFRRDPRQPDLAAELTATNTRDDRALTRFLDKVTTRELNRVRTRETVSGKG